MSFDTPSKLPLTDVPKLGKDRGITGSALQCQAAWLNCGRNSFLEALMTAWVSLMGGEGGIETMAGGCNGVMSELPL